MRSGDGQSGPWTYTVGAAGRLFDTWTFGPNGQYDLSAESFDWYDLTVDVDSDSSFEQRIGGHVETGSDGVTDPAIGA